MAQLQLSEHVHNSEVESKIKSQAHAPQVGAALHRPGLFYLIFIDGHLLIADRWYASTTVQ